ncbi:APC family permease [Alicyclobacillus herbarius]|uniref:APC family permease n=1 Tax=Alicyclobacillus herbarius TaxID=122960 RepID=UPI0003FF4F61|nr:amino acid permease [Alicyclobacillus herbarius]
MSDLQLHRRLTWVEGSALAIGAVLGSGVLILPAMTAQQAGPASILAWIFVSLLSFPVAWVIGTLGASYPHAGGIVEYARVAFGSTAGRITAWLCLGTIPIGVPIIALVGADYVAAVCQFPHWTALGLAALMLGGSLYLHRRGIGLAAWTQVLFLAMIVLLMFTAIVAAAPHMKWANFHPLVPYGFRPIFSSAVEIFWCYVGWEMIVHLAEEFQNPERDLRRTFLTAPLLVAGLYIALSVVTVGTHAYGSKEVAAPLSQLVTVGLGRFGSIVTGVAALFITIVAIHGNVGGFSRMVYSQARDGVFPDIFARLHSRFHTPTIVLYALGIDFVVVLTLYMVCHVSVGALVPWPSVLFLVLYMIAMASALKLVGRSKPGARIMAWIALLSSAVCIHSADGRACIL